MRNNLDTKPRIEIPYATGASITSNDLEKTQTIYLNEGELCDSPVLNTKAINGAIEQLSNNEGGNVYIGSGKHLVYTIELKSNVNLILDKDCVLCAAPVGESNYLEPEVRLYTGLQDHGHTYFRNSLIYAENETNISVQGEGLICGKIVDKKGFVQYVLSGDDPANPIRRDEPGHNGEWFGNKAIAFLNCKNVVLKDFSIDIGGHFAIITTGVENLLVDNLIVDTNRDALDVDCCQNVTVKNSVFNSLTDDAIVLKASYGAEKYMRLYNVLVKDCTVSGYDASSVISKKYTTNKKVAEDACGPTGRVKLGTESTCGYELVTIQNIKFDRSRGLALETVDGAPLVDVIVENLEMKDISSSPIFLRVGDRGRYPVSGISAEMELKKADVRLDNVEWVIPNSDEFTAYPPKRYKPSYNRDICVNNLDGDDFYIVNPDAPVIENKLLENSKLANACGYEKLAYIRNVRISNIKAVNVDSRYPIIIAGLMDSKVENVEISNISIEYNGGLSLTDAVEQKQIYMEVTYSQEGTKPRTQRVPLMVNPFFLKNEGLLERKAYDADTDSMIDAPYNVPELADSYPEPSQFGILPAYGLYVRHAKNLFLSDISVTAKVPDSRSVVCLDDVEDVNITNLCADIDDGTNKPGVVTVKNNYKRHTNMEYVIDEPYMTTDVTGLEIISDNSDILGKMRCLNKNDVSDVVVNAPAPGTPKDSLYSFRTV